MNKAILCLGGNATESDARISDALTFLGKLGDVYAASGIYVTKPEYGETTADYINDVVFLETPMDYEELKVTAKNYESGIRAAYTEPQHVILDIDIVVWNGDVVRPKDFASSYFRKGMELLGKGLQ